MEVEITIHDRDNGAVGTLKVRDSSGRFWHAPRAAVGLQRTRGRVGKRTSLMAVAIRWPTEITESLLVELGRINTGTFELASDGTILMSPPTGTGASLGESELHDQVRAWSAKHTPDAFVLPATGGITLPDNSIWSPDTTWIKRKTFDLMNHDDRSRTFWRLIPDAVFELLSPTDIVGGDTYNQKITSYRTNNIALIVVIDPKALRTLCYRDGADYEESFNSTVDLGQHMPGFVLDVGAICSSIVDP